VLDMLNRLLCQIPSETPPVQPDWNWEAMRPVAILLAAAFVLIVFTRRRMLRRQKKNVMVSTPPPAAAIQPREMYDQLNLLMSELVTLSRQINGEIDTRCARLNILLREADQKIAQFEKLHGLPPSRLDGPLADGGAEFKSPAAKNQQIARGYNDLSKQNRPMPSSAENLTPGQIDDNDQTRQILELAKTGMSPLAIAKTLDRPVGEIQLILAINNKNVSRAGD
jgi:hypothetical protein